MNITCDTTRYIYEVLEKGEYSFLFNHLKVIDVGCNIGAFGIWIYPKAEVVHSVDLDISNIKNLQQTIKDNNLFRIIPYCCAIAGRDGTRKAIEYDTLGDGAGRLTEEANKKTIEVDAYTLNSFMSRNSIDRADILKLDVEGAEYEILQAPDFPREKVSTVVGEWHLNSLGDIFHNLGYEYKEWGSHFLARR